MPVDDHDNPPCFNRYRVTARIAVGSFAVVYRGFDEELRREVAVKVLKQKLLTFSKVLHAFHNEARILASLEHPGIVPIYDVGHTVEALPYLIERFVEGCDLRARLKQSRVPLPDAVEIVASVAEALHHAHRHGLVHRDVKPGNILLDQAGRPLLVDFGLALRQEDYGTGPADVGTPLYMSPEQARKEGHRVDARTDVYSLGVVFYEMLTGRHPFEGGSVEDILECIRTREPKPPRQIDDTIPSELERIWHKAAALRASERYGTAHDFAADLRLWQAEFRSQEAEVRDQESGVRSQESGVRNQESEVGSPVSRDAKSSERSARVSVNTRRMSIAQSSSGRSTHRMVPRGLRSFGAQDADFFLELLPGPRDRDGLPDSIQFWKTRLESTDPEQAFCVGVLYGPSGCGKSSLVKAGLVPRLSTAVVTLFVDAGPAETEARLRGGLRRRCPGLPAEASLAALLAFIRTGQGMPDGNKFVLVIDQFEQWLHASRPAQDVELIEALRQCDGVRVQCLLLVRDDFWLPISRFMRALEIPLVEDRNTALVDRFDPFHARKVLAEFGRAFGRLPDNLAECTPGQERFLDQAVAELAEAGSVIPVRLSLFADMVKGKSWSVQTLKDMGGMKGLGFVFLEETFNSPTAPPAHRLQQKAAAAVLQALLPPAGSDLKGSMRTYQELLEASGDNNQPESFRELLAILDQELRLVTPVGTLPEGSGEWAVESSTGGKSSAGAEQHSQESAEGTDAGSRTAGARAAGAPYQLTHDYLIPGLRSWLNRNRRQTFRGRAELRLSERAAEWNLHPENRQLPAWWEWLNIRLWTRTPIWSGPERKMMRSANRYHTMQSAVYLVLALVAAGIGLYVRAQIIEERNIAHADQLVAAIQDFHHSQLTNFRAEVERYRYWAQPKLEELIDNESTSAVDRWHARLVLLPIDPRQVEPLKQLLLSAEPSEFLKVRAALLPYKDLILADLWRRQADPQVDPGERFRAACALAAYDPDNRRWLETAPVVIAQLMSQKELFIGQWLETLRPVRQVLLAPLTEIFRDREHPGHRLIAADALAAFAADQPEFLAGLILEADVPRFTRLWPALAERGEEAVPLFEQALDDILPTGPDTVAAIKRRALAAVALLRLGRAERVWPLLHHSPDPRLRSFLIHSFAPLGADPQALVRRYQTEPDMSARRALLLSLGEFPQNRLSAAERQHFLDHLLVAYRADPDPGLHAAAEWLLRLWNAPGLQPQDFTNLPRQPKKAGDCHWYVNGQGQTLVVILRPQEFQMGSPPTEFDRLPDEVLHTERIPRSFAVAAKEVTIEEYSRFQKHFALRYQFSPRTDCPITRLNWYDAARYCRWLSEQENIPPEEMCYPPIADIKEGMKLPANYLERTGYRLPTEAEWEYACRAGAVTDRFYGNTEELLGYYSWYWQNARGHTRPVGSLKPNDLGLFDVYGNVWEWCDDRYGPYGGAPAGQQQEQGAKTPAGERVLRGGGIDSYTLYERSAARFHDPPADSSHYTGLRVARTVR